MRRALGAVALLALVVTAGCAFGSGEVDAGKVEAPADYGPLWNVSADAVIDVGADRYRAVYRVENASTFEVYGFRRFNNERPIDPIAVRFRYPNGTVVGIESEAVEKRNSRTVIDLPASEGAVAYSAPKTGKRIRVPVLVEGSHEVILPPEGRVRYPLLGRVIPRGYERTAGPDGRVHIIWEEPSGDRIVVRYYLVRDLLLFGALVFVGLAVTVGGLAYFWLQLRELRRRREEVGLDVETGDDSGGGRGPF